MKLLQFVARFRTIIVLAIFFVFSVASVMAQPDPVGVLQSLPADFNWAWFGLGVLGMVLHWGKRVIWKEEVATFDEHFFKNLQWTLSALGVTLALIASQTETLKTLPLISFGAIIPCLMAGFTADSGLNSPGTASSKP